MKNNYFIILFLYIGILFPSLAQKTSQVDDILKAVEKKYTSKTAFSISFRQEIVRIKDKKMIDSMEGNIIIKKNKYVLTIGNQEIFNNGEKIWNYSKELNEVYVSNYEEESGASPFQTISSILSMYKKNFKYVLEQKNTTHSLHVIQFVPKDSRDESIPFFQIKVFVTPQNEIKKWEVYEKGNLIKYIFMILNLQNRRDIKDSFFTFYPSKYSNLEVIE